MYVVVIIALSFTNNNIRLTDYYCFSPLRSVPHPFYSSLRFRINTQIDEMEHERQRRNCQETTKWISRNKEKRTAQHHEVSAVQDGHTLSDR